MNMEHVLRIAWCAREIMRANNILKVKFKIDYQVQKEDRLKII